MSSWIVYGNDQIGYSVRCSFCGEDFGDNRWLTDYWYCPNCGKEREETDAKEGAENG